MEGEKQDESGIIPRLLAPFVERLKGRPLLGQLIWDIALRCQIREDASPESIAGEGGLITAITVQAFTSSMLTSWESQMQRRKRFPYVNDAERMSELPIMIAAPAHCLFSLQNIKALSPHRSGNSTSSWPVK